jgi:hypothetical protein
MVGPVIYDTDRETDLKRRTVVRFGTKQRGAFLDPMV